MKLSDFEKLIKDFDKKDYYEKTDYSFNCKDQIEEIINKNFKINIKSIVGIDIYKYSQYALEKQILIPIVFDLILKETKKICICNETIFFEQKDFNQDNYIPTGDGGFYIFNNPLQSIVFIITFYKILYLFNSGHFYPGLHSYVGEIIVRTCITYDKIYPYENNWYGTGIIKNARILSKDKLNRFLIDENTFYWFQKKINGIESLCMLSFEYIINRVFKRVKILEIVSSSIFFPKDKTPKLNYFKSNHFLPSLIKTCHCQKIGYIKVKEQSFDIFNIELQVFAELSDEDDSNKIEGFILSIGNLNSSGILDN